MSVIDDGSAPLPQPATQEDDSMLLMPQSVDVLGAEALPADLLVHELQTMALPAEISTVMTPHTAQRWGCLDNKDKIKRGKYV